MHTTDKVFALLRAIKAQYCPSLQTMPDRAGSGIERLQNGDWRQEGS